MTQISTAGSTAGPSTPTVPSTTTSNQNRSSSNATQTARPSNNYNQSYHRGATRTSQVAVRFVHAVNPSSTDAVTTFRKLLSKFLLINNSNPRANVQLLPVGDGGTHISHVNDLGYSEDSLNACIANLKKISYASSSKQGQSTVYEHHSTLHLQHDVPFGTIKGMMLGWLKTDHIYLNQVTTGVSLLPVAWLRSLNPKTHNMTRVANNVTDECITLYNSTVFEIPSHLKAKHDTTLNRNGFLLQANATHLSGRNVRADVMQLSVIKDNLELAVLLLDNITSM